MKFKIFIYTSLLIFSLLCSCEKTIDFSGKIPNPQLVLNCAVTPDSTIVVNLTKSKFFLSNNQGFTTVDNAVVSVTINDLVSDNLKNIGNGNYVSKITAKPNDKVKINASATSLESVSAEVTIRPKITIISVDTLWSSIDNSYNYPIYNLTRDSIIGNTYYWELRLKIKFQDNSNEQNYYRLIATANQNYYNPYNSYDSYGNSGFEFDDIVFGNSSKNGSIIDILSSTYGNNCFSDELINGKEYSLSIKTNIMRNVYISGKKPKTDLQSNDSLTIDLQQLSKSFYLYRKTKDASTSTNPLFSEPVQIYSNITGGMGILGSFTSSNIIKIGL